jgi:hypothetical protein
MERHNVQQIINRNCTMNFDINKDFLGFVDWGDFFTSFLGIKYLPLNIAVSSIAVISSYITEVVWESAEAIYFLYALMGLDWFTGLYNAIKTKTYWSRKNFRMPIYFIATTLLLMIAFNAAKYSIIYKPMPAIVYGGFLSVYISSILENAAKLKWLPGPMAKLVINRFGFKVLFDKDNEKESETKTDNHDQI